MSTKLLPEHYSIQFHPDPSVQLLHDIANFIRTETRDGNAWDTTAAYLSLTKSVFAIIKHKSNPLVAVASLSFLTSPNAWLGSVVVAKVHRRKGIATILVSNMLQYAAQHSSAKTVSLIAAAPALYSSMSFHTIPDIDIMIYVCESGPLTNLHTPSHRVATEAERGKGLELYESITGMHRHDELENIVKTGGKCIVVEQDNRIVAAVWGQRMAATTGPPSFFIAPLVAQSPDFAIQACVRIMEIEKYERGLENNRSDPFKFRVLALRKGSASDCINVFETLGFKLGSDMPYMAKCIKDEDKLDHNSLDFLVAGPGYYGLLGWELG